ncbi:MAG: stage III sporulation protein AD [Firmicutes bacterium]|nr:stage III sporulation protein AD [Bacillota bacterium]
MQEMTRIVAMAIVMAVLLTYLRSASQGALASQLAIAFMVTLLLVLLPPLQQVMRLFVDLGRRAQIRSVYMAVVLKAVGTAYIAALGAQLAKDAKEETTAAVVEMAGKVLIMLLAVPLVAGIMEALVGLMP